MSMCIPFKLTARIEIWRGAVPEYIFQWAMDQVGIPKGHQSFCRVVYMMKGSASHSRFEFLMRVEESMAKVFTDFRVFKMPDNNSRLLDRLEVDAWMSLYRQAPNERLRRAYYWKVLKLKVGMRSIRFPEYKFCGMDL